MTVNKRNLTTTDNMAKIDLDKFVCFLIEEPMGRIEGLKTFYARALKAQGLVCRDGDILTDGDVARQEARDMEAVTNEPVADPWSRYMAEQARQVVEECKPGEKTLQEWFGNVFWATHPVDVDAMVADFNDEYTHSGIGDAAAEYYRMGIMDLLDKLKGTKDE